MAQQRRWSFILDIGDDGESWRWIHVDSNGVMTQSTTSFSDCYQCQVNAGGYGWQGVLIQKPDAQDPPSGNSNRAALTSRYVASVLDTKEGFGFDELMLAVRYVHSLPKGTLVEVTDMRAPAGSPFSYVITSGTNVVRFNRSHPSVAGIDRRRTAQESGRT